MRNLTIAILASAALLSAESVAGLKWTAPASWKKTGGTTDMRAATYTIPAAAGDKDSAECVVYFFGAGGGGTVEANIDRWKGQVVSGGKPAAAKVAKKTVHGMTVTSVDSSGDYMGMGGPMAKEKSVKSGYRLLGAVIEGRGGNVFLKFTGPTKTIAANEAAFQQMVSSFDKEH